MRECYNFGTNSNVYKCLQDRARNTSERMSSTTTLTVTVKDDDDQDPSFIYRGCSLLDGSCVNPEYTATVSSGVLSGVLAVQPDKIHAVDMDSLNRPIQYSFSSGTPSSYKNYFDIDTKTGAVRQISPVDTSVAKKFEIIVKAEESSEMKRFATAKLVITVRPVDSSPPVLTTSSNEGLVTENAPIGTPVLDNSGQAVTLSVHDDDIGPGDPQPTYTFELTTNFFRIEPDGKLVVNEEGLDRDPPSPGRFRFQVVAREKGGNAASAPLSLMVTLKDVNDNSPRLPMIPPVTVQAGDAVRRVIKVNATDKDEGENAEISYSIYHVSNNGGHKFKIDPALGVIETTGKLSAGEQYSITVQTIVEVTVVPGPNTRSPQFSQHVYEVEVSEGVAINATVLTVHAVDPENDPVTYSIASGNELRQFAINDKTGVISVIRKLDREDLTRYQMDTGGLSSTATVNIKVSDINDKNPEFVALPYEFSVLEGTVNTFVGRVTAVDADEGANAVIYYSVPEETPFAVDAMTGEIRTRVALDFEKQQEHRFVVTARDGAPDPRLATATVTVHMIDADDEVPTFEQTTYKSMVPENMPDLMVTQVKAEDPDTVQHITYIIRQGPTDLFTIDPVTGVIRTIRGLDYEREKEYVLVIGTVENPGMEPGATTRVIVTVEDRNDIPPVFTSVPPGPVTINDDVAIGYVVASLTATDSDGTSPNNKVRYELIGRGKASKYFQVDPDRGTISVRDDLKKETDTEYELSSSVAVHVRVKHANPTTADGGLGFADDVYTVELREDAPAGQIIKTMTILNVRAHPQAPLECRIIAGDEQGLFTVNMTQERACQVKLNSAKLDFETTPQYRLQIRLDTFSGLVNPDRGTTTVRIILIIDILFVMIYIK
ncbi:hypothetical protein B566_EDAN007446 [Ephemera danica]|nr:hypothetical protein B566_EDAN007446 [Ephemera danica]